MGKATFEIHESLEGEEGHASRSVKASIVSVIIQIIILDAVFSSTQLLLGDWCGWRRLDHDQCGGGGNLS